jgi:Dolichyl-phosphate-mannose-protein mannosyltransferase
VTTKRAKTAAPPRAPERAIQHEATANEDRGSRIVLWLSLAWAFGFCLFFYSFTLPNNHISRFVILFILPDLLPISEVVRAPWGNLFQRADIFGVAIIIWAGAWAFGHLLLRAINPPLSPGLPALTRDRTERGSGFSATAFSEVGTLSHPTLERTFFAMALGLSAVPLLTLGLGVAGLLNRWLFVSIFVVAMVSEVVLRLRVSAKSKSQKAAAGLRPWTLDFGPWTLAAIAVIVPFLLVMWLGSMSPDADFDVGTYHYEGPKEYFQNGRITFLPHNFYTNFPFLTEMFALSGMVLHGDWYWGAIAGKCALFGCVPLTSLGLYAAGRRWFSDTAGLLAAVVYVTTPWIDRVSIIGLSEGGVTYFVFATTFAAMLAVERLHAGLPAGRWILITGLFAGSGMGCKYTGLMQLVIPAAIGLGVALLLSPRSKVQGPKLEEAESQASKGPWTSNLGFWTKSLAIFAAGVAITIGPWLLKNVAFTGNPVYPLGYNVFGGRDWTPELNAKFVPAHSPKDHHPLDLGVKFVDVMADNDWSSPLVFALAPLALFVVRGRRISIALSFLVVYFIVTYWAFTHRIDRFWVPLLPVAALLAGVGATVSASRVWKLGAGFLIALAVCFNFGMVAGTPGFCGYNAMLTDRTAARLSAQNAADSFVEYLNEKLPPGSKVLAVGDSQMFGARFPVVYNTVFNPSIFKEWLAGAAPSGTKDDDLPLKPPKQILDKLHAEGITHIYIDWDWIRRYREPGNYTFTDFVRPVRFQCLVRDGVLGTPVSLGSMSTEGMSDREKDAYEASLPFQRQTNDGRTVLFTGRFGTLSDQEAATLKELGPSLMNKSDNRDVLINAQVFPVK